MARVLRFSAPAYDLYGGDRLLRAVRAGLPDKSTAELELTKKFVCELLSEPRREARVRVRCGTLEISADRLRLRLLEESGPVRSMEITEKDLASLAAWATG